MKYRIYPSSVTRRKPTGSFVANPTALAVSLLGNQPGAIRSTVKQPSASGLILPGSTPQLLRGSVIVPSTALLTATGRAPAAFIPVFRVIPSRSVVISGNSPTTSVSSGVAPMPLMNPYNVDILGTNFNWSGTTVANSSAPIFDGSGRMRWGTVTNPLGGSTPFQLARIINTDGPVHGGVRAEATAAASLFPIGVDTWAAWKIILPVGQWPTLASPTINADRQTFCQIHTIDPYSPPFGIEFRGEDGLIRVYTLTVTDGSVQGDDVIIGSPYAIPRGVEVNFILQYNRSGTAANCKINVWVATGSAPSQASYTQICNFVGIPFGNQGVLDLADYMKGPIYKWTYLSSWGPYTDRTLYWRGCFVQTGNNLLPNAVASLQLTT